MRCDTCNAENGAKSKFCRHCGAVMTRPEPTERPIAKRCDDCKVVAAPGAAFCTCCGCALMTPIKDPVASSAAHGGWKKAMAYAVMGVACVGLAGVYLHLMGGGRILPQAVEAVLPESDIKPAILKTGGPSAARPWLTALRTDLRKCEAESVFTQPFCREKAKFKHCEPDRWGTVNECPRIGLDDNG
jgi:ribosomal protein L40E